MHMYISICSYFRSVRVDKKTNIYLSISFILIARLSDPRRCPEFSTIAKSGLLQVMSLDDKAKLGEVDSMEVEAQNFI